MLEDQLPDWEDIEQARCLERHVIDAASPAGFKHLRIVRPARLFLCELRRLEIFAIESFEARSIRLCLRAHFDAIDTSIVEKMRRARDDGRVRSVRRIALETRNADPPTHNEKRRGADSRPSSPRHSSQPSIALGRIIAYRAVSQGAR